MHAAKISSPGLKLSCSYRSTYQQQGRSYWMGESNTLDDLGRL